MGKLPQKHEKTRNYYHSVSEGSRSLTWLIGNLGVISTAEKVTNVIIMQEIKITKELKTEEKKVQHCINMLTVEETNLNSQYLKTEET
jgi:hypothetical protein